jgi:hypothetical protein
MTDQSEQEVVELLRRIEAYQRQALAVQQDQVALAKEQYERSEQTIQESRTAVGRGRTPGADPVAFPSWPCWSSCPCGCCSAGACWSPTDGAGQSPIDP